MSRIQFDLTALVALLLAQEVRLRPEAGESVAALARDYGTSRQTVMRVAVRAASRRSTGSMSCGPPADARSEMRIGWNKPNA